MLEQPLKFFVVFFVVVEPVSLIPLFTGLTAGATRQYKRRMALKAVSVSAVILLLFALGGAAFLTLMGISLEAFRIFGGLLLFLLALEMVFARESGARTSSSEAAESRRRADIRSEEHTSELQSRSDLVCRLLLEKKKKMTESNPTMTTKPRPTEKTQ